MEKLSVIVPIYNNEKYLKRCIDSIINQTYPCLEIILVNDGSTDDSLEICKEYAKKDKRIKVIDKENGGVSSARNAGLIHTTGSYVTFVDSDDFIDDRMYETKIKILKNDHADVIESGYRRFNDEGFHEEVHFTEEIIFNGLTNTISAVKQENNFCVVWNKIYKTSLFQNIYFPNFGLGEDYYVNVKIASRIKKKITITPVFYNYYANEEGLVSASFSKKWFDDIESAISVYQFLERQPNLQNVLPYSALDIVEKTIKQYVSLYKFHIEDEYLREYLHLLNQTFSQYYGKIPSMIKEENLTKRWRYAIELFNLNPTLFDGFLKTFYTVRA